MKEKSKEELEVMDCVEKSLMLEKMGFELFFEFLSDKDKDACFIALQGLVARISSYKSHPEMLWENTKKFMDSVFKKELERVRGSKKKNEEE